VPGYTFKGIYKELQKHMGSSVQNYIVAARTAQGYDEWKACTRDERLETVTRWKDLQSEISKQKKHRASHGNFAPPSGFLKTRHLSWDERRKLASETKANKLKKVKDNQVVNTRPAESTLFNTSPESHEYEEAILGEQHLCSVLLKINLFTSCGTTYCPVIPYCLC